MPQNYITQEKLAAILPKGLLDQALTDGEASGMTAAEVWDEIMDAVEDQIHGALAPRYAPPYAEGDNILYTVRAAARVIAKKEVFERRNLYDEPLWKDAEAHLAGLRKIGQKQDLAPSVPPPTNRRTIKVISEAAKFSPQ